jgi:tRNA threonylcarbamoyladenosine biosynthesis protein TsaB
LSRNVLVLSLDTTTRAGSVAVVEGNALVSELVGDAALTHGARLPTDLIRALETAGRSVAELDLLAVAVGPGSFTGLRVGIAAMQGLAMATGKRIVPVSALDALAVAGAGGGWPVATWMDAQRGEVFAAIYDATGTHPSVEATALAPEETLDVWKRAGIAGPLRFIGDGAVRYADVIRQRIGVESEVIPPPPLAAVIGRIAAAGPERAVLPHAVVPVYIRRPDAEIAKAKSRV